MIVLSTPLKNLLLTGRVRIRLFVLFNYLNASDVASTLGFWNGEDPVTISSVLYNPILNFIEYPTIEETTDNSSSSFSIPFSGLDDGLLTEMVMNENNTWHQQDIQLYMGFYNPDTNLLVERILIYEGIMDKVDFTYEQPGGAATMHVYIDNVMRELALFNSSVRSDQDQRLRDNTDDAFWTVGREYSITWGEHQSPEKARKKLNRQRDRRAMLSRS